MLNSKYKHFIRTDYKACFDSIYSHTFTWLIGKDSIDTKSFESNSNIYSAIDRILQNINARRSNGIVVGPEFSRMIAELLLQSIDTAVYNKLINSGVECGQDYNVYRYVDDIFIFAKSEELATHIVEKYSEIARKYLLQLNETKLFSSRVPFILDGWLNETNGFTNRMCDMLFNSKEEQKAYVEKISAKEDDAETPTSDVLPYLLKSHVVKGFCVAYDVRDSMDLKSCLFPVQYTNQRLDISSEMVRQVQKIVKSIDETHQKGNLVTMLEDKTLIYLPQLLYNIKHSSWSYEKEYRCIIASTANGMPFIDAKPKAIYIGRDCSDKNADCLFDIADEHEAKIYKMGFDDCVDSYELYYYEFYK